MFDLGFTEMLVVGIIALLVLGPERLPGAVRTVGLTIGRIKRGFADVRSQVEREIGADEIRQQLHNERIMATLEKEKKPPEPPTPGDGNKAVTQDQQTSSASETTPDVPSAPVPAETPADDIPKPNHER